ncbi:hypothetical protein H257_14624 [Aphanomyces astaci]|uniref:DDE Tnp4 domain-containing protein n=1 Tax=Aphanomyces astaci TaxID=112090 RepID=W4FSH7_APHAT|nr:hypothetical protein H257_14624 [Aphanomyces astaci]ETV69799.1 hypothetical protein H257_14624 [Aphanomyces astaci]|eukprot:XP_009840813.1 hypothetical protein H257_14624 [Aphanomyces astaci]
MKDPTKRLKMWANGYRMDELHSHLGDVGCRLVLGEKEDAHKFIFHFLSAMPMCLPAFSGAVFNIIEFNTCNTQARQSNGALDAKYLERNRRVSSDRIVVENFFGRVCSLWRISSTTFTWGEKIYLSLQKTTFALTNFHLSLLPLRAEDENYYAMFLAPTSAWRARRSESVLRLSAVID